MPELMAISSSSWISKNALKQLRQMYGQKTRLCLHHIPMHNVWPEWFCKSHTHGVEMMIALLQEGAWLNGDNWQPYVRYTIAKRLRVRLNSIFTEPFFEIRGMVLDYQLNGGTFKTRDNIKKVAVAIWRHPDATEGMRATARLLLSVTDDNVLNTLIQPFHWIRTAVALSDHNPVFSMGLAKSEMFRQKVTLCQMLRAKQDIAD